MHYGFVRITLFFVFLRTPVYIPRVIRPVLISRESRALAKTGHLVLQRRWSGNMFGRSVRLARVHRSRWTSTERYRRRLAGGRLVVSGLPGEAVRRNRWRRQRDAPASQQVAKKMVRVGPPVKNPILLPSQIQ